MSFMSTARAVESARAGASEKPRIFLIMDSEIHSLRLCTVLANHDCDVVEVLPNAKLPEDIENLGAAPALFVFPIDPIDPSRLDRIRFVHTHAEFHDVPILGLTRMKDLCIGLDTLRDLGIVGVADTDTSVDHLAFRVNQLVRPRLQRRRWERVDVFLPVEFELDGVSTSELAVNLSIGGMGLRCSRKAELNADVRIAFHPPDEEPFRLEGRIVQSIDDPRALPRTRIAVVFYPTDDETTERLGRVVSRMLSS